jgi:alpha-glucoside transport system substrate-binding protein
MFFFRRQNNPALDKLVETYKNNGMSRRSFLQSAMALGVTASSASALLAACGTTSTNNPNQKVSTLSVIGTWSGSELTAFNQVKAPFEQQNNVKINFESTRDVTALLTSQVKANNPPDLAILPNPGAMQQFAAQGALKPLDSFINTTQLKQDYNQSWIDLGSYNNHLYAIFYKAANKGTIWYSPTQFQKNNYQIPHTWDDLISLSNKIAGSGKYPWSIGVENGAASGWPGVDWVDQIFLNQSGPDLYDQWVAHKIPWTHSSVKEAFNTFAQIITGKHYIDGAPQSILSTNFENATYTPFSNPPTAYMDYLGDFAEGFIAAQYPNAQPGTDFNFFNFPQINPKYAGALTGGADVVVALQDNATVQAFVQYLASAQAQTIWVKLGGFTSPNKSVDLNAYPNEVAKASAQQLTAAPIFRYGAGDLVPPAVQTAYYKGMLTFIANPTQIDSVLSSIESVAKQNYN